MKKKLKITINNQSYLVTVEEVRESALQAVEPQGVVGRPVASRPSIRPLPSKPVLVDASRNEAGTGVVSPMPGVILNVKVQEGDSVKQGDVVVVLEAMKMENEITAKKGGVVGEVLVKEGQTVSAGEVIMVID
ncbi:biotin/lipoyl-containing protein [Phosphitispora fastidiosa]|uniref:biotin/lipoyl-containing protein n=1 Tax=Phosphitispora fastidiosa TaxID=2837202 RepID=UPI001E49B515|nr:biotin/lipoyl-containing protein [Phosphitispora fastidiosa]MBU7007609.1 biotin carboxyl carrier protein [Phosphitispora fastidiosa]